MTPDGTRRSVLHSQAQQKPADASQGANSKKRQAGPGARATSSAANSDRPTEGDGGRSHERKDDPAVQNGLYHRPATPRTSMVREEREDFRTDARVVPFKREDAPEKLLPQNVDAEAGVLGSLLIDPEAMVTVSEILKPEDFYRNEHRTVYRAALDLYEAGGPADYITVCDELERRGKLEEVGGTGFVGSLANGVPTSRNANSYANIVREKAILRRLIHAAGQIAGIGYNQPDTDVALVTAQALIYELAEVGTQPSRYQFLPFSALMDLPDQRYLLDGLLADDSISLTYAESGIGKTFTWLDIALSMAFGRETWHGVKLVQGPVAYIAAEGGRGVKKRVEAWCQFHGHQWSDDVPFYVLPHAVPLLQEESLAALLMSLRSLPQVPQLIIIDTLARSMDGGDENLAKDVNSVFAAASRMRELGGAHVAIIHHTGKDAQKGGRGSYALKGNADTELYFTATDGCIQITTSKQKEDERVDPILLRLQKVWLDAAMTRSSCVVVDAAGTERPTANSRPLMDPAHLSCLVALSSFSHGARANDWQRAAHFAYSTWNRHRKWLIDHGYVEEFTDFYVLTESGQLVTANHCQTTATAALGTTATTATTL